MNTYTLSVMAELKQIRNFDQLHQIRNKELNSTNLLQLEWGESLVTEIREEWMCNKLFEGSCYRNYVQEIILRYCQNREYFRKQFGLKDGMLINIEQ